MPSLAARPLPRPLMPLPAALVRFAREMQAAGRSLCQIAAELEARGIMTARGGQWTAMAVRNVLARAAAA
jgi:hypothetical protein